MKKLFFTVAVFISLHSIAQNTFKEDVDMIQSIYGKTKKELVGAYMKVEPAKADGFWKLYDRYEDQRKSLSRKRMGIIADYANNYSTLTDDKANQLANELFANNIAVEKLHKSYYRKFKKLMGGLDAAKLMQVESYLQNSIRAEVQEAIPFIGEIDRSRKKN